MKARLGWLALVACLGLTACASLERAVRTGADITGPSTDACTLAASAVNPATLAPGLGGTGAPASAAADPGGIGGTGQVAQQAPGLGGTGQVAEGGVGGTGVVGVVTGFGSICVNGLKIEYAPDTPVQQDGRPVPQSRLAVGQVVALQAAQQGERLQAQRIAVLDAAVGPLDGVDADSGRFSLMGQRGTALVPADLRGLAPGQWVRVSGQRLAEGEIRATRVQATEPGPAWVAGALGPLAGGGWQVAGTPLAADGAPLPPAVAAGQEVGVSGRWADGRLQVEHITARPTRDALGSVRSVVVQGYVHSVSGSQLNLGFENGTLSPLLRVLGGPLGALRSGQPVLLRGRLDAQQGLVVDRLEIRREGGRGGSQSSRSSSDDSDDSNDSDDSDDSDDDNSGSGSSNSGSGSSNSGSGSSNSGSGSSNSGSGSSNSGSGSSNSGSGSSDGQGRGRGRGGD